MELANEAGVKIETINFIKLPPGLHGLKTLQLALHELLCTMGKANYSATTSLVSITSKTCGTDLLNRLNDTISPKSGDTTKPAKNKYTTHKDSFHNNTDFVAWWTTRSGKLLTWTHWTTHAKSSKRKPGAQAAGQWRSWPGK